MADSKLHESNISKSNYNLAVVSHYPYQQNATIVVVEKPSIFSGFLKNFGISLTSDHTREKTTFCILFIVVLILFLCSLTGFVVMWFTEIYNDSIISNLVLSHNSTAAKLWETPPLDTELRIHLFNYTNADRYMKGLDDKLKVEDVGPYIYTEKFQKIDVTFNSNHTISYRENRSYTFEIIKSAGHQYDKIIVPNIVLLTAASLLRNAAGFTQFGANIFLSQHPVFKKLTAHEFIWGYKEPILELKNKYFGGNKNSKMNDNIFGMLKTRNGTSDDVTTIFTGEDDMRKLSLIDRFNGQSKLNFWSTDECNRLDGSDGSQFPPHWMDTKHALQVYIKAFCRKFPLVYEKEVNILNGIPAWRYKAPHNIFAHPDKNPANACYCNLKTNDCPPSGVFNATLCFDDAPIFSSFPHFLTGDPVLFENIEGLAPDEKKHLTYADIHPRLAFPIGGASRFQINVQVQKEGSGLTGMTRLKEGQYLPILWMEVTSGELSTELRNIIYHSTFSANAIQLSLRYGSLLVSATTMGMLVAACYYNGKNRPFSQRTKTTT